MKKRAPRQNPNATSQPTKDEFIRYWHGNAELKELYDGVPGRIPSAAERQEELIDVTLVTAIEAVVLKKLKRGTPLESIKNSRLLVKDALTHGVKGNTPEEQLDFLREKDWIASPRDLLDKPEQIMATFRRDVETYLARKESIARAISAGDFDGTSPNIPTRPEDPRVRRFNALFSDYFEIYETGPKSYARSNRKAEEKGGACQVTDINRITVVPKVKEYADHFCTLLHGRFSGNGTSRSLDTGWKIKARGHLDAKHYVALTQQFHTSKEGPQGGIGEIKIEGPQMHAADKLTHPVYKAMRLFENEQGEVGTPPREEILQALQDCSRQERYDSLHRGAPSILNNINNFINEWQTTKLDKNQSVKIHGMLNKLIMEINLAEIARPVDGGWRAHFLETAYEQRWKLEQMGDKDAVKNLIPITRLNDIALDVPGKPTWEKFRAEKEKETEKGSTSLRSRSGRG